MELYLDSADINEIEEAFKLGFIDGLNDYANLYAQTRHY